MSLVSLAIWLAIIILLSYFLDLILRLSFSGRKYRLLVAPGVILHELSHAFACICVLAKVKEISFFDRTGGYVRHEKSKVPIIGPVIISLAPLFVGIILVYLLANYIISDQSFKLALSLDINNIHRILGAITNLHLSDLKSLVAFYLVISVSITMAPSFKDFTNAFLGIIATLVILVAINYFFVIKLPETHLIIAFSMITLILIVGLIFSMIFYALKSLIFG